MNNLNHNDLLFESNKCFVLKNQSPDDVARAIIESGLQKQPFYIFDMDEAHRRIQHFKLVMPRVKIFYAMKANDADWMLKLAVASQVGFDCASPGEIYKLRRLNVDPLNIIYAMPSKTPEQMIYARDTGIVLTTFDTASELTKLKKYWPNARLLIRIRVDGKSVYNLGEKFGCDFETEAISLLEEAAALNLLVIGVAFHVGSACSSVESHEIGIKHAKALFDHEARAGRRMNMVDIGGGFISDTTNRLDQVASIINDALKYYFPKDDVEIIAEPGRYISDSSTTLYCNLINTRRVKRGNDDVTMIYMNDGLFGTLRYNEAWHTVRRYRMPEKDEPYEKVILWGPSCDSTDRVMQNVKLVLPVCTPSDWLVFPTKGAYSFYYASHFSCLPLPRTRVVISSHLWKILQQSDKFKKFDFVTIPNIDDPLPSSMPDVI